MPPEAAVSGQYLAQEALHRMRSEILTGAFSPASRLPFALLQQRYGVSVGTIREALSHLVSEGLVIADAGRGFRVAPMTRADLLDIAALRIDFEQRALRDAITHGNEDWEVGIISSYHLLARIEELPLADRLRDINRWTQLHRDFHQATVAACRSRWLLQFRAQLFDQADRYRILSFTHRPKGSSRREEHREIMQAALDRDIAASCRLAETHIMNTVEDILRFVELDD